MPLANILQEIFNRILKKLIKNSEFILAPLENLSNRYEKRPSKLVGSYFEKMSQGYPKRELKIKPYFDNI